MLRNYLKAAWRSLTKNRSHSFINIAGLAVGMAVVVLIGLWIWDEISFDGYHKNLERIVQVMQKQSYNGDVNTRNKLPMTLATDLATNYPTDFKFIVRSTFTENHLLAFNGNQYTRSGNFMDETAPDMLTLKMVEGNRSGLHDQGTIFLSQTTAKALFGNDVAFGKIVKLDDKINATVTGVYQDLPYNTSFRDVAFIADWQLYLSSEDWLRDASVNCWGCNSWQIFAQLSEGADIGTTSARIKNELSGKSGMMGAKSKTEVFLFPMNRWHLYSDFKNGVNTGGRIQFVWLFGIIGAFVLLLACINFMNLSTAGSEQRAREVGIRKAIGSARGQLTRQFFLESFLITIVAFAFCLFLVQLALPVFNEIADKQVSLLWTNAWFWVSAGTIIAVTGLLAGIYPALYLSSFKAVKVLKGNTQTGPFAGAFRQVLVVLQFSVSISLIIGTMVVFRQISFARDRALGYNYNGLVTMEMKTTALHDHFDAFRAELQQSGAVDDIAESTSPTTAVNNNFNGIDWRGKDPKLPVLFGMIGVSPEYGKIVGWQFREGRGFARQFLSDSMGVVLNEAAAKTMGFTHPVGEWVMIAGDKHQVIGVIKDMVMESPFEPVKPALYYFTKEKGQYLNIKLNAAVPTKTALDNIAASIKKYAPSTPFAYSFVDEEYGRKFAHEERIGRLSLFFAALAIFICSLGLFGMASFLAARRVKEIGLRKLLGASVFDLWSLLSGNLLILVIVSFFIATPATWYFMHRWLQGYEYRTTISWWLFPLAALTAIIITLFSVSYHAIRAALANPIESLRNL